MKTAIVLLFAVAFSSLVFAQESSPSDEKPPEIKWGKCGSLKPTEKETENKQKLVSKCLEENPRPKEDQLTRELFIRHTDKISECVLKAEGMFNNDGSYKFDQAKQELISKSLPKEIEQEILKKHDECQGEAIEKLPKDIMQQINLYQGCMDFHVSQICGIELVPAPGQPPIPQ